jgi:hypothetical protein
MQQHNTSFFKVKPARFGELSHEQRIFPLVKSADCPDHADFASSALPWHYESSVEQLQSITLLPIDSSIKPSGTMAP